MTPESQVIVYNPDVNLTERKSALNNNIQEVVTVGDLKGYKVYTALLTQLGAAVPTANVLENSIGPIVWTRFARGRYIATLSEAFVTSKTYITASLSYGAGIAIYSQTAYVDSSDLRVYTFDLAGNTADANAIISVEIRVYN